MGSAAPQVSFGTPGQHEVLVSLEPFVRQLTATHLEKRRLWFPNDLLGADAEGGEAQKQDVERVREAARGLPDGVRVALALNLLTEEGLPHFHRLIATHLGNESPWSDWNNLWTAEEDRHGCALRDYVRDARVFNMGALERMQYRYIESGFNPDWQRDPYRLLAYTSLLHADTSPLGLAAEHVATEQALKASGLPYAILRNGWYTENYTASIPPALQYGVLLGSAGDGKIASATRSDYAAAAAAVLRTPNQAGKVYELAGDTAYTLTEFAAELTRLSGKAIAYQNLPQADYAKALLDAGLPDFLADLLADSDTGASKGALFDDSHQLSQLIGRPTTPLATAIAAAL